MLLAFIPSRHGFWLRRTCADRFRGFWICRNDLLHRPDLHHVLRWLRHPLKTAKPAALKALVMFAFGTIFTALFTGLFCHYVLHFDLLEGLLTGAVLGSTDAASVFPSSARKNLSLKGQHRLS